MPGTDGAPASDTLELARRARRAGLKLQAVSTNKKNAALRAIHESLQVARQRVLEANAADCAEAAQRGDVSGPALKRLDLSGAGKYDTLLAGVQQVERLTDPVGRVTLATELAAGGPRLYRVSCPIGVLCVIFESRPDAAVQISTLGLKSSNAVLLKGGREALRTNRALVDAMRAGIAAELGEEAADMVQLVSTRSEVAELLQMDRYVDLVIPRGSNALVRYIQQNTTIPVLGHADGICTCYVDASADADMAAAVVLDSKTQYPAACNALETLLCHKEAAERGVLAQVAATLLQHGVELRAEPRALSYLRDLSAAKEGGGGRVVPATDVDFDTEFLALTAAVKVVDTLSDAMAHVNEHGSHHTDCIITQDAAAAEEFMAGVDSAGVYHNASTRFADGFRYGFGSEVGVSTNRIHARGPVGLDGLVIYKYRLHGNGDLVTPFTDGKREFTHQSLPLRLPSAGK